MSEIKVEHISGYHEIIVVCPPVHNDGRAYSVQKGTTPRQLLKDDQFRIDFLISCFATLNVMQEDQKDKPFEAGDRLVIEPQQP